MGWQTYLTNSHMGLWWTVSHRHLYIRWSVVLPFFRSSTVNKIIAWTHKTRWFQVDKSHVKTLSTLCLIKKTLDTDAVNTPTSVCNLDKPLSEAHILIMIVWADLQYCNETLL